MKSGMSHEKAALVCILTWLSLCVIATEAGNVTVFKNLLNTCKGIVIRYIVNNDVEKIIPISDVNATQPYKFLVDADLTNAGYAELHGWQLFIGFQYHEVIAEAPGVAFLDGSVTPGVLAGNGTTIIGTDMPDLLTSIETAEDFDFIAATFNMTGTEFGVGPEQPIEYPLPRNLTLLNPGYSCDKPIIDANTTMLVCCPENKTANGLGVEHNYLPRYKGDLTLYFDVIGTMEKFYEAQVTINLDDPIGKMNQWNLTWDWREGEFITTMVGAETLYQDQEECIDGKAGKQYPDLDFGKVMSCQKSPSFVDLNEYRFADQNLIGCCRNGTLLPAIMDPLQSQSVFQLEDTEPKLAVTVDILPDMLLEILLVYKLKPYSSDRDLLEPPNNWRIGELNENSSAYECDHPRLVSPSKFFVSGLHYSSAVKSWQVTCNKTALPRAAPHKCCVSFSAYYNSSVIPCSTCACGCKTNRMEPGNVTCNPNPNLEPMLLPSYGLLLPPSNRTLLASTLAKQEHLPQPNPMPCPDNCGVSLNWHIYSDYTKGFSTRLTLFNWDVESIDNWFTVVEMAKASPGYQDVYSFNGTQIVGFDNNPNTSLIFMDGKTGYNTQLLGLDKGLIPGKLQSLMSFDKRKTPGINVVNGDGYPVRMWFNGDECTLPDILPISDARRSQPGADLLLVVMLAVALLAPVAVV